MGMTMTQKILAAAAGLDKVEAGQLIEADLDLVLGNDITSPVAIHEMDKMTVKNVFDKDKIALVMDHFIPNKDIKSAEHCKCVREFACKNEITNYFDVGEMGIEHALLPEKGLTVAGDVVIGADSHTCTYGALGAFSTGVGSTDMAAGMATGKAWFKVPSAIRFNIVGKPAKWVSEMCIRDRAYGFPCPGGFFSGCLQRGNPGSGRSLRLREIHPCQVYRRALRTGWRKDSLSRGHCPHLQKTDDLPGQLLSI